MDRLVFGPVPFVLFGPFRPVIHATRLAHTSRVALKMSELEGYRALSLQDLGPRRTAVLVRGIGGLFQAQQLLRMAEGYQATRSRWLTRAG